jgi:hypothetical protein
MQPGAVQPGIAQIGIMQVSIPQFGSGQVDTVQPGIEQVSIAQIGITQVNDWISCNSHYLIFRTTSDKLSNGYYRLIPLIRFGSCRSCNNIPLRSLSNRRRATSVLTRAMCLTGWPGSDVAKCLSNSSLFVSCIYDCSTVSSTQSSSICFRSSARCPWIQN